MISLLLDLLLPHVCVLCGRSLDPVSFGAAGPPSGGAGSPLCRRCLATLRPIQGRRCARCGVALRSERELCMRCRDREWSFDRMLPLFAYEGSVQSLLKAYKFGNRRSLAGPFAELLHELIRREALDGTLVPVPPRPGKLRKRGWDQVEAIAVILERRGLPLRRVLERKSQTQQKRLGRAERDDNARAAYRVRAGVPIPRNILLLDDVITTCATADACAAALRSEGAERVVVLALATD